MLNFSWSFGALPATFLVATVALVVSGVDALIAGAGCRHHGRIRRDGKVDRQTLRDHAFARRAVIRNGHRQVTPLGPCTPLAI